MDIIFLYALRGALRSFCRVLVLVHSMVEDCAALAEMRCVFILALGRTGSTHLLRLLNNLEGYRISGETDNSWIHMGWFMESIRAGSAHGQDRVGLKRRPVLLPASAENATLCDLRRLMLEVHNPSPRARCAAAPRPFFCRSTRCREAPRHHPVFAFAAQSVWL